MNKVKFALVQKENDRTGQMEDTLVKQTTSDNGSTEEEQWCTVPELDRLFDACSRRWQANGWDLEKLITCVNECDFE
jgi:hypothetical protein